MNKIEKEKQRLNVEKIQTTEEDLKEELLTWKSPLVARTQIEEFTNGAYKTSSMSTFDASGDGVNPRYRLGRTVFYTVEDLTKWLANRRKTNV